MNKIGKKVKKSEENLAAKKSAKSIDFTSITQVMASRAFGISTAALVKWFSDKTPAPKNRDASVSLPALINWKIAKAIEKHTSLSAKGLADLEKTKKGNIKLDLEIAKMKAESVLIIDVKKLIEKQTYAMKEYFTESYKKNLVELMHNLEVPSKKKNVFCEAMEEYTQGCIDAFCQESNGINFNLFIPNKKK